MKNIEILYEDDFCMVINKPAGLAVQGGKGVKTSLDKLLAEIRNPPPLLVHRLDKDTSGVILTAKGREEAARFSRFFGTSRKAVKLYIAVCSGRPEQGEGVITDKLLIKGSLKTSDTRYKLIKSGKLNLAEDRDSSHSDSAAVQEFSILEIELGTGRMHQIRRHLAMKGNPVLGDDKYGDFSLNKKLRKAIGLKRLLLHASRIIINDRASMDIQAPLPEYFRSFFA